MNGKRCDVLITEDTYDDPKTGIKCFLQLLVYADPNQRKIIEAVPGVMSVTNSLYNTMYEVKLDPRYDREWVKAEIEAQIKINSK